MSRLFILLSICLLSGCYDYPDRSRNVGSSSRITGAGGSVKTAQEAKDQRDLPDYAVTKISLNYQELSPGVIQDALPLPYLEILDLKGTDFGDDQMSYLLDCPQLKKVLLDFTDVTDRGLWMLPDIPELEYVSLSGCNVTDQSVDVLLACKRLKEVSLIDTHITKAAVERLEQGRLHVTWLGTLDQEETRQALSRLQRKNIRAVTTFELPSSKRKIPSSFIYVYENARVDAEVLADLKTLEKIGPFRITVAHVKAIPFLGELNQIDELKLYAPSSFRPAPTVITAQDLADNPVKSLTMLDISVRDLTAESLIKWVQTDGLEDLKLRRLTITPSVWQAIVEAPSLKRVEFNFCTFEDWDQFQPSSRVIECEGSDKMLRHTPEEARPAILRKLNAGKDPPGKPPTPGDLGRASR